MPNYFPPCEPGTRVRFFYRHRGLTPDTTGKGTFVEYISEGRDHFGGNWVVEDQGGRRWYLIPEFGDTMEPIQ